MPFSPVGRTLCVLALLCVSALRAADPVVSNVRALQRAGTKLVDVVYDVADADSASVTVSLRMSSDGGITWDVPCLSASGSGIGAAVTPGSGKSIVWDAGADWNGQWSDRMQVEVTATDGDYLVIDLSDGPNAPDYPVSSLAAAPAGGWTDEYKTTKLVLRRIPAGTFTIGSPEEELGHVANVEAQYQVTLTQDFYLGVFEVTQRQYERVMGTWPSYFSNAAYRDARPVEQVSWVDVRGGDWPGDPVGSGESAADTFVGRLRARTGLDVDLPTGAQWEYACRAGTATALNSGRDLTASEECPNVAEVARYYYNSGTGWGQPDWDASHGTAEVGSYGPNAWGLHDMHGNVAEWCLDWFGFHPGPVTDPVGPLSPLSNWEGRELRGGNWLENASGCRSASNVGAILDAPFATTGLRVCSVVPVR